MGRRRSSRGVQPPTPGDLGLPERSALTIEGRLERADMVGTHLARRRQGRERALWRSDWAMGLWLIFGVLVGTVVVTVIVFLI